MKQPHGRGHLQHLESEHERLPMGMARNTYSDATLESGETPSDGQGLVWSVKPRGQVERDIRARMRSSTAPSGWPVKLWQQGDLQDFHSFRTAPARSS